MILKYLIDRYFRMKNPNTICKQIKQTEAVNERNFWFIYGPPIKK